jgi:hypothetical protein
MLTCANVGLTHAVAKLRHNVYFQQMFSDTISIIGLLLQ